MSSPDPNDPIVRWAAASAEDLTRTYLLDQDRFWGVLDRAMAEVLGELAAGRPARHCVELVVALTKFAAAGAQLWGDRTPAAVDAVVAAVEATRPRLRVVDPEP